MSMVERVLDALKDVKAYQYDKAPPLHRLCWRLGLFVPPPMLARFWFNVVFFGLLFGVTWGAFMALFLGLIMGMPLWLSSSVTPLAAGAAGVLFGLSMAGFAHVKASHHERPSWQSLVDAERSAH